MNTKMNYEADDETINSETLALAEQLVSETGMGDVDECYTWLTEGDTSASVNVLRSDWIEYNTQQ